MPKGDYKKSKESIVPLRGVIRDGVLASLLDHNGVELGFPVTGTKDGAGVMELSVGGSTYGASPLLYAASQIKWGSYGDSIANVSSLANFDLRQISASVGFSAERMGGWIGPLSNGLFRLAANCGVSGESTTQMLAREAAGPSATRKAIADAAGCSLYFLVNSMGINDIQTLAAGAAPATIAGVVNTALGNAIAILKKQKSYGMWPITHSLLGYNYTGATAGEIATRQGAVRQYNAALGAAITDAGGQLGSWVDVYPSVTTSSGAWIPGLDQGDGLHPGANGCKVIYSAVVGEMMRVSGVTALPEFAYPQAPNLFANADLTSATSGVAAGFNIFTQTGTCTLVKRIVDWRGQNWQEVLVTPTALDGSGNAGLGIDITIPNATIALGDVVGGELSLYIDDGAGKAPSSVFQFMTRLRGNATYNDMPQFVPAISPKVALQSVVDHRVALLPIVEPVAAPATSLLSVVVLANSLTPFLVRVALPRAFKLPAAY